MTRRRLAFILVIMAVTVAGLRWRRARNDAIPLRVEDSAYLMGTTLRVVIDGLSAEVGTSAAASTFEEVGRMERMISTWDSTSALSRLNRSEPDSAARIPDELFDLLLESWAWSDTTGRAFEPAIGPLIDVWGVRSGLVTNPPVLRLQEAQRAIRTSFAFDPDRTAVTRLDSASWIDAGGFGKGAGLRAAARLLRAAGVTSALLDFGGQGEAIGVQAEGDGWRIAVAHPERRQSSVAVVRLESASIATSGSSERPGHLIDPRSGRSLPPWGSVTVIARDALVVDALSTGLYVMGPEAAGLWAEQRDSVAVLILEVRPEGLRARWNEAMNRWLEAPPEGDASVLASGGSSS